MISEKFGKTFVGKEYKQKRERDLFETEKALLPETQEIAMRQKRLKEVNKEIAFVQEHLRELKRRKRVLEAGGEYDIPVTASSSTTDMKKITIKCPIDECRGFVSSATHTCGICDTKICKDCREPLNQTSGSDTEQHTCDPNTLETVRLLKRDTKSCPKCGVGIHKIEGCDQMYCTQCHTAFSWRTGEIVIGGRIHNPHYFEYLRRVGGGEAPRREVGDIPCGGLPCDWDMRPFYTDKNIMNAFRNFVHIERVEFRNYRTDRIENNRDLRIKYLNKEVTEEQFKKTLQKREKDIEKKREILQVLNTCVVVGSEILRRLLDENAHVMETSHEISELREFTNESMEKISKLYNCVVPIFSESTSVSGEWVIRSRKL
jgi:ribosomal protein S27AE